MPPGRNDRQWTVIETDPETGKFDRSAALESLHDIEAIGHREGGLFTVAPIRVPEVRVQHEGEFLLVPQTVAPQGEPTGNFVTIGWEFIHTRAPAARVAVPEPAEQPVETEPEDAEPEPVPAG